MTSNYSQLTIHNSREHLFCLFFFFSLFTFHFSLPPLADAHVLKTDINIGAVLHISPQDDPAVGQESSFFFEFKDRTGRLNANSCLCTVSITEGSKMLVSGSLITDPKDPYGGTFSYVFPKKGVYQVLVSGTSVSENTFQPFKLSYDLRVERTGEVTKTSKTSYLASHFPHLIGAVLILAFFIFALIKQRSSKT